MHGDSKQEKKKSSRRPQDGERGSASESRASVLDRSYPRCRALVGPDVWRRLKAAWAEATEPESFSGMLALRAGDLGIPPYLPQLARLEWALERAGSCRVKSSDHQSGEPNDKPDRIVVNPTLQLLDLTWRNLCPLIDSGKASPAPAPEPGKEYVLAWRPQGAEEVRLQAASNEDLLVLKIVMEDIDPVEVARANDLPVGAVDSAISRGVSKGLLVAPPSRIRRDPAVYGTASTNGRFLRAPAFVLQWHITQACDLHCKHCYDRSPRASVDPVQGLALLDDLRDFCRNRHVAGQVTFTGGNPLLHPQFLDLYRAATERGLAVAILGNPSSRQQLEGILAVTRPAFFQVSLEGLQAHNDLIRGPGNFGRVMAFLAMLKECAIPSKVMLTLTNANLDQVLPLGERLQGLTDDFTFNRLSMVGEGANLRLPSKERFVDFLEDYFEASARNRTMGLKDNLFNIIRSQRGLEAFGGCTGYGCGAAFNFVAVLSDGEAHACRKFPSPIGNVLKQGIAEVYESPAARRYRSGPQACRSCALHRVCRGCFAVASGHGLDIFRERDPYCFMPEAESHAGTFV